MTATVTIPPHKLRTLLASVIPACAPISAGTPILSAIRIKIDVGGQIEASATNRYIAAQNSAQADTYAGSAETLTRAANDIDRIPEETP